MPLEHTEWYTKQSAHENDKLQARQACTYYSVVNVNKTNYPYLSSYEQQQTWTLTRTMANNHKRYQSSIENIFLTTPNLSIKTKSFDYEKLKAEKDRSISFLPFSTDFTPTSSQPSIYNTIKSYHHHQNEKSIPVKSILSNNSKLKNNSTWKESRLSTRPMRVVHINGELVVRI
ncbi:hypothetical protein I4U23_018765 [Adineta vaga]|nr:hypothetical protein I4U23_018765 [Adineta vaga]